MPIVLIILDSLPLLMHSLSAHTALDTEDGAANG